MAQAYKEYLPGSILNKAKKLLWNEDNDKEAELNVPVYQDRECWISAKDDVWTTHLQCHWQQGYQGTPQITKTGKEKRLLNYQTTKK